jgi:hypothetical protein
MSPGHRKPIGQMSSDDCEQEHGNRNEKGHPRQCKHHDYRILRKRARRK